MHTFITAMAITLSILLFYVLVLWFFHKANVHFKKLDENVGNIGSGNEDLPSDDYSDSSESINAYIVIHKKDVEDSQTGKAISEKTAKANNK